ncbi:MAG: thioredoxin [Spirochaetota bacterium]|nr:thioredoxin [Spirochaetota bacterium]
MANLVQATDQTFESEVLKSTTPVLVDFWAPWCMPCKMQTPILESLKTKMGDDVKIVKVNTDENSDVAQKFNIMSIPTLMIFKNGEVAEQMIGLQSEDVLTKKLNQYK